MVSSLITPFILLSQTHGKALGPWLVPGVFQMGPEQIVLLLELLLEEEKMSAGVLQTLERTYSLRMQDAEVAYVSSIDYIIL